MTNENPVWFVTGCSTGFGREIVKQLLADGKRVVVTARRPDSIADLIKGHEDIALGLELDVTKPDQIDAAVTKAEAHFGRIDVLVNNAGYGYFAAIEEGEDDEIRRQFEVNVFGLNALTQRVLPGMRARKSGHIFNFSSIGGMTSHPALGYYCATKFAVEALSEALSKETAPLGIKVTIVEPSGFRTDWAGRSATAPKNPIDDYAPTAGRMRDILAADSGNQQGDPVRAAKILLEIASLANPPLRLPLGSFAYSMLSGRMEELKEQIDAVRDWTVSADFPEGE
ncbi:SDR family NAD(P)-dependent oxidoreductase [Thalassospira sp. MA62]|nr:SDR family NAD(P)-dependent oxidoreductase [Thalassospira sp. MA62]